MSVLRTEVFIADVEEQYEWYARKAGLEVADLYLDAVEATCRLLGLHPFLGPRANLQHPQLCEWRFFLMYKPFRKHLLFYEINHGNVVMRRAMHGQRDLPHRLLEPP